MPQRIITGLGLLEREVHRVSARLGLQQASLVGVLAATYAVATVMLGQFSYSWVQVRISEALAPLPYVFGLPAVIGLTFGVVVANLFSPVGLPDVIFGPLLTFAAALLSWKLHFQRRLMACVYPVVVNSFGVSAYVASFYGVPYELSVLSIGVGEFVATCLVGYPLLRAMEQIPGVHLKSKHPTKENFSESPRRGGEG